MISFGKNTFEIVTIGLFLIFAVAGVVIFSAQKSSLRSNPQQVTMWGALPQQEVRSVIDGQAGEDFDVSYRYIPIDEFETTLVEALAAQEQPDLILFPHQYLTTLEPRTEPISYEQFSRRSFTDIFIDGAEIFLSSNGIRAIPFAVDPLVLFYNQSKLSGSGYVETPTYWDQVPGYIEKLADIEATNVREAGMGIGRYSNIRHANALISAMFLQAGIPIVQADETGNSVEIYSSGLRQQSQSVVRFYTEFSDPTKSVYTWNAVLPEDFTMFSTGNLAMYFGLGSEVQLMQRTNPNLDFDIDHIPYVRGMERQTFGTYWVLSVVERAPHRSAAFTFLNKLVSSSASQIMGESTLRVPVRRDVLASGNNDYFKEKLYEIAITTRAWPQPSPEVVQGVFSTLIEDVATNQERISDALEEAERTLQSSLRE